jgi:hypothetical protein
MTPMTEFSFATAEYTLDKATPEFVFDTTARTRMHSDARLVKLGRLRFFLRKRHQQKSIEWMKQMRAYKL